MIDKERLKTYYEKMSISDDRLEELLKATESTIHVNRDIDIDELRRVLREFMIYFEGYTHHDETPLRKLLRLYLKIEEIVFGERKTESWQ